MFDELFVVVLILTNKLDEIIVVSVFSSFFVSCHRCIIIVHIVSFDVRDKSFSKPKHWSAPEVFGPRAKYSLESQPESLIIKVSLDLHLFLLKPSI